VTTQISSYGGNPSAPVGGHVVAHASDYRFFTRVGAQGKRKISLKDNSGVPEFDVEVEIGWGGLYGDKTEKKNTEKLIFEKLGSLNSSDEEEGEGESTEKKVSKVKKESKKEPESPEEIETAVEKENTEEDLSAEVEVSKKKKTSKEATA